MSMMLRCFVPALLFWHSAAASGSDTLFGGAAVRRTTAAGHAVAGEGSSAAAAAITAKCTTECNFNWKIVHKQATCMIGCEKTEQCKESVEREEEKLCTNSGNASAVILGGIGFIMAIFYLVNSREKLIADQTWSLISTSISIFVAVMLFGLVNTMWKLLFGMDASSACVAPTVSYIWVALFQMLTWWLVIVGVLACHGGSILRLKAYGTIGGHILGFSAIHLYGFLAISPEFNSSPWMTLVVILVYFVTMPLVVIPTRLVGNILKKMRFTHVEELNEQAKDTAIDFFAMGLSFLFTMFFRGLITGKVPSIHGSHHDHPGWQVFALMFVGVLFIGIAAAAHSAHHKAKGDFAKEAIHYVSSTLAMISAWCLLDGAGWYWLHYFKSAVQSKAAVAMIFSVVFVISVFLMWFFIHRVGLNKRYLRGAFTAIALTVGLSWEHTFDAALEGVGCVARSTTHKYSEVLFVVFLTIIFAVVVTPAWVVYILPKHDEDLMKDPYYQNVRLPLSAVCCDLDDDEEYEYEMTEEDIGQGVQFLPPVMMAPQYMQPTSFANVMQVPTIMQAPAMSTPYMQPMSVAYAEPMQYMQPTSQYGQGF